MAGAIESAAVFEQRALAMRLTPTEFTATGVAGLSTMGRLAFACCCQPGAAGQTAFIAFLAFKFFEVAARFESKQVPAPSRVDLRGNWEQAGFGFEPCRLSCQRVARDKSSKDCRDAANFLQAFHDSAVT
jgi:hypothetical protein